MLNALIATLMAWPQLHSFSIGLENSPDLLAARKAAHFLGTVHHEYVFTIQEGLDAIPEVIYHLETFDVTTVRASTPMYLLSRKIKAMGVKMVLSGEGSDEILGGLSIAFDKNVIVSQSIQVIFIFTQLQISSLSIKKQCEGSKICIRQIV
jgi:asparagine synthetase B (glutamine-hydrolysing)